MSVFNGEGIMDFESLQYYVVLANTLNMTKAASQLFITQQTLSNRIRRLESELGVTLFNRKPSLSLTDKGELLLSFSNKVLRDKYTLMKQLQEESETGIKPIRFGTYQTYTNTLFSYSILNFKKKYPDAEILLSDFTSRELIEQLYEGKQDLIVSMQNADDESIETTILLTEPIYFCVSDVLMEKYYPGSSRQIIERLHNDFDFKEISLIPITLYEGEFQEMLLKIYRQEGIEPNIYSHYN